MANSPWRRSRTRSGVTGRNGKAITSKRQRPCSSATTSGQAPQADGPAAAPAKRLERREIWWRQHRAVVALLEMEVAFCELGSVWFDGPKNSRRAFGGSGVRSFPEPDKHLHWIQSVLRPAVQRLSIRWTWCRQQERIRAWAHPIEGEASRRLPDRVELVIPGRYPRWRSMAGSRGVPDKLRNVFEGSHLADRPGLLERQRENRARGWPRARDHRVLARNIRPNGGDALFSDALHNAAAMLAQQVQTPEAGGRVGRQSDGCVADLDGGGFHGVRGGAVRMDHTSDGREGDGLLGAAMRLPGAEGAQGSTACRLTGFPIDGSAHWNRSEERFRPGPRVQPVVRRTTLRDTLSLPASKRDLPEIYRLLFRLAPVEDQRFLMGREQELAGLEQALKDWETGRFAACLVVGARGSGKTSLLNCAAADIFAKRAVVRGTVRKTGAGQRADR